MQHPVADLLPVQLLGDRGKERIVVTRMQRASGAINAEDLFVAESVEHPGTPFEMKERFRSSTKPADPDSSPVENDDTGSTTPISSVLACDGHCEKLLIQHEADSIDCLIEGSVPAASINVTTPCPSRRRLGVYGATRIVFSIFIAAAEFALAAEFVGVAE